jgi:hypothetical protein
MRSYAADDLVSLPKLSATGGVALGQGLLTAAKAKAQLPALIATRLGALETAHTALHRVVSNLPQIVTDPQRTRNADLAEDQAWSAFHDWLVGWSKLRVAEATIAQTLYAVLFPTRLKFTKLAYKLEWAEAEARLSRIAQDGLDLQIEQLGGKVILEQLKAAHLAYGEALGITAEGQESGTLGVREPLTLFLTKLRAYVLAVAAHADDADESSVTLTESLLAPLYQWKSRVTESITEEETAAATSAPLASQVTASPAAITSATG